MGCDYYSKIFEGDLKDFNPRSPNGLRLTVPLVMRLTGEFQSTQPEWAATVDAVFLGKFFQLFQSTQPEWAATICFKRQRNGTGNFNPRSPNGLRQALAIMFFNKVAFQSTQPEWAATV